MTHSTDAAAAARGLASDALAAIDRGDTEAASALAAVAHVFAKLASAPFPVSRASMESVAVSVDQPAADFPADPDQGIPALLLRAHDAIQNAGGQMHTADLATLLGEETQALGTELSKLLRAVGIRRPRNGTIRIGSSGAIRTGFEAATLAVAIRHYRTKANEFAA